MVAGSKEWQAVKEKYKGVQLAEFLMIKYVSIGGYPPMEKLFNVRRTNFQDIIKLYKKEVYKDKPYIVDLFDDRVRYNKYIKPKERRPEPAKEAFTEKVLESLPTDMEYTKFISVVSKYDTDKLTGDYLARLAIQKGIKLYNFDLYTNKKNYIKF